MIQQVCVEVIQNLKLCIILRDANYRYKLQEGVLKIILTSCSEWSVNNRLIIDIFLWNATQLPPTS